MNLTIEKMMNKIKEQPLKVMKSSTSEIRKTDQERLL